MFFFIYQLSQKQSCFQVFVVVSYLKQGVANNFMLLGEMPHLKLIYYRKYVFEYVTQLISCYINIYEYFHKIRVYLQQKLHNISTERYFKHKYLKKITE